MSNLITRTESAHSSPLLIKSLFESPIGRNLEQEILYRDEKRFTYRQFHERVGRLAAALVRMGVKEGDTVAVMDFDTHRYLECYFAVPMIGAVLHTVNIRLSPEQLIFTMDHAEDDVLLIHAEFLPVLDHIKNRIDTVKKFILLKDDDKPHAEQYKFDFEYEDMLAQVPAMTEFPDFDENTRATTFYTTGTTGMPKGVYFSHRQLVLHTLAASASLASSRSHGSFHRDDVYMPITPMFHVHAWGIPYIATFLGVKQVYPGKYVPDLLLKLIDTEKVTFSHCVPTIMHMLLKSQASEKIDLSAWKVVIGGSALTAQLCLAALARGIDIYSGYGMSETCPVLTLAFLTKEQLLLPMEQQAPLRCRTGSPIGLVSLQLTDDLSNEIVSDDKASGEVLVRSPWLTQGYLKDHVNSEKLWSGGWLHTNDVACRSPAGSIRITDRKKDLIKVGGEWLSSLEIEDIIAYHPSVAENAVVGQADEQWGEVPVALTVVKPGLVLTEREIINIIRDYIDRGLLAKEAVLLKVKFIDAIDRTSVGKVNKVLLREKYTKQP
jgi:fatty-acyl-CoA synthase